jgi:hypothetical protein
MPVKRLFIDPSIRHCGYASFEDLKLRSFGILESSVRYDWKQAADEIADKVKKLVQHNGYRLVAIEMPSVYGGSGAVARDTNSITKLAYGVGVMVGMLRYIADGCSDIDLVPVLDWKGNLPKQLTTVRVTKKYGVKLDWRSKEHNTADAIALGDWYLANRA